MACCQAAHLSSGPANFASHHWGAAANRTRPPAAAAPAGPVAARVGPSDPSSLVDTFVGTGSNGPTMSAIDTFPGADMPFGMLQWSPDTTPDRSEGGGYTYTTSEISGFSLTNLSGVGCSIFGDVPVLPTSGAGIAHVVSFNQPAWFPAFGLPPVLPAAA